MSGAIRTLARLKDHASPLLFRFPSLWFVGLYEVLLGTTDPVFVALARTAGGALGLSFGAFGLACALSYFKHFRKTLESAKRARRPGPLREGAAGLVRKVLLRSPEERAVAMFFSKTIRTSPKHRVVLVNGLAVGFALVTMSVLADTRNASGLGPANAFFLGQSLLLVLVLLAVLRVVVDVPVALESNWVFRVTESAARGRYVAGLKKTIFVQWFLPFSVLVFLAHLWLWREGWPALLHATFCLVLGGLGIEAVFFHFQKVPFASSRVPGKLRLQTRIVPYVIGLLALLSALAWLERSLLARPGGFAAFLPAAAAVWVFLWRHNASFLRGHPLVYDEEPEPALAGFPEDV